MEQTQANFSLPLLFHLRFHLLFYCGILWKMHPTFLRLGKSLEASSRSKLRIDWSPERVPFPRSFLGDKWALITEYCVTQRRHHHGAFPDLIFQRAIPARKELNKALGTSSALSEHFPGALEELFSHYLPGAGSGCWKLRLALGSAAHSKNQGEFSSCLNSGFLCPSKSFPKLLFFFFNFSF